MNEKNLPDDINSKTLDELTQEAQKLINKLEKDENLQNSISSYQELVKLNKIIEKKFFRESQNITKDVKDKINIPLIYHGGASNKEDFLSIINFANKKNIRLDALAAGSGFQFSSLTPAEVAEFLHLANIPVRQIHNNF